MNPLKRNILGLAILLMVGFVLLPMCFAQQLQITSPPDGTVVSPGQTVNISVSTGQAVRAVAVIASNSLLKPKPITPHNNFSLTIPANMPLGVYGITAMADDGEISRININVENTTEPTSINILGPSIKFRKLGDQIPLQVFGSFSDGSQIDVTNSSNVKYSVANTAVASVSPDGLVTAVGPGGTTVTASYAALKSSIPVVVPLGNAAPFYKVTAKPVGSVSKNVDGNYTINMNITNDSNVTLALVKLTSATLNNIKATWIPGSFTVFDPGISQPFGLNFPATAGKSGTTAVLQLKGIYEGPLQQGQIGQQGAVNFNFRVRLP